MGRVHLLFVSVDVLVYRKDIFIHAKMPRAVMAYDGVRAVSQRAFKASFVVARFASFHQWLNVNPVVRIGIWARMGRELSVRIGPVTVLLDVVLVYTVPTKIIHLIVNRLEASHTMVRPPCIFTMGTSILSILIRALHPIDVTASLE